LVVGILIDYCVFIFKANKLWNGSNVLLGISIKSPPNEFCQAIHGAMLLSRGNWLPITDNETGKKIVVFHSQV
jgi:hypothetical protein